MVKYLETNNLSIKMSETDQIYMKLNKNLKVYMYKKILKKASL